MKKYIVSIWTFLCFNAVVEKDSHSDSGNYFLKFRLVGRKFSPVFWFTALMMMLPVLFSGKKKIIEFWKVITSQFNTDGKPVTYQFVYSKRISSTDKFLLMYA